MQFQSSSLNTNASMYLYDTPRDTMANDLMFQRLFSTSTWKALGIMPNTSKLSFHVFQSFMLNTNVSKLMCSRASRSIKNLNYRCDLELLIQQKTSHQSCDLGSMLDTRKHTHTHTHIYIYHMQLDYTQYIKQMIMFICSGLFEPVYQNKTSR